MGREAVLLLDEVANFSGQLWISAATMIVVAGNDGALVFDRFRLHPPRREHSYQRDSR